MNHIIDPTFFYDAIEEFAFNYTLYHLTQQTIDDDGKTVCTYETHTIRGSFQPQRSSWNKSKTGNTETTDYDFYCKSLYRIDMGDIITHKGNYYQVISVQDYDEFGVRECSLSTTTLTAHRDLADYIKYERGEIIV